MFFKKIILFSALLSLFACEKNNPDPAWIQVNKWTLIENPDSQYPVGELTQNFTDATVYIDNELIGVFEIPFKIPVLKSGMKLIRIYPTIKNNGISATKKKYPFVEYYEITANLVQNQTLEINPVTRYKEFVNVWLEDFEDAAVKIENDPNSAVQLFTGNNSSILKWGNFYGNVDLTSSDSLWVAYTSTDMILPKWTETYLEIDYYNTANLVTGVLAIGASAVNNNQNIQLNKQSETTVKWKKIYIDLKEIVSNAQNAEYFKMSFQSLLPEGQASGKICIDNLKVIHF